MPGGPDLHPGAAFAQGPQGLVGPASVFMFIWCSMRKSVVYAPPAVLNSLCLRGLPGRDPQAAGPAFRAVSEQQAVHNRK